LFSHYRSPHRRVACDQNSSSFVCSPNNPARLRMYGEKPVEKAPDIAGSAGVSPFAGLGANAAPAPQTLATHTQFAAAPPGQGGTLGRSGNAPAGMGLPPGSPPPSMPVASNGVAVPPPPPADSLMLSDVPYYPEPEASLAPDASFAHAMQSEFSPQFSMPYQPAAPAPPGQERRQSQAFV
jgi:hypothetical protein